MLMYLVRFLSFAETSQYGNQPNDIVPGLSAAAHHELNLAVVALLLILVGIAMGKNGQIQIDKIIDKFLKFDYVQFKICDERYYKMK